MRTLSVMGLMMAMACSVAQAEKAPMSTEEKTKIATDIAVGTVRAIYSREQKAGDWHYVHYVAEIAVEEVEKGKGLAPKTPVYVRYWRRGWTGEGRVPPSTSGHRGCPDEGDRVRVYLARDAYDGFTFDNKDGGFNVLGADGFEPVDAAGKPNEAARRPR